MEKNNSKENEDGNIIPIVSEESKSNQKVGELTMKITYRKPTQKQKNSSTNLRKLLGNFNRQKNRD
jgi:hypothetical protein